MVHECLGCYENESQEKIDRWIATVSNIYWVSKQWNNSKKRGKVRVSHRQVREELGGKDEFLDRVVESWIEAGIEKEQLRKNGFPDEGDKEYFRKYTHWENILRGDSITRMVDEVYCTDLKEEENRRWGYTGEKEETPGLIESLLGGLSYF